MVGDAILSLFQGGALAVSGGAMVPQIATVLVAKLKRSFEVSPGDCSVRLLVRDNQTGRMGDIFFPLNVK
jgi:hypothetical protein